MKETIRILLTIGLIVVVGMLVACGNADNKANIVATNTGGTNTEATNATTNDENASTEVKAKKTYKVGMDAAYKPFEYTLPDGSIAGFDVDIMKAMAEAGGFEVEFSHVNWEGLFESVNNGQIDIAASAVTISAERLEKYDFANPYFEATQLILAAGGANVASLDDLKGLKIGVQQGTTGDIAVREHFGKTFEGIKPYENIPFAIQAMNIGDVNVVVADNAVVLEYIKANPNANLKYVEDANFEAEYYGHLVKKGNTELADLLNISLEKIKANGKYQEIYKNYFGEKVVHDEEDEDAIIFCS